MADLSTSATTEETTTTPAPGSPEYDAAMAAKFDKNQVGEGGTEETGPEAKEERPSWLPEQFKTPEDLAKSYAELRAKMDKGEKPDTAATNQAIEQATEKLEANGVDLQSMSDRFFANGERLEEADYAELEKHGFSRHIVDGYIQGQVAVRDNVRLAAFNLVGGEDAYGDMIGWAKENLSASQITAFNTAVDGPDADVRKLAIEGVKAQWKAAVGDTPMLINGGNEAASGTGFRSMAEVTAAMKDPRYKTDPAYRADISQRLANSTIM